MLFRSTVPSTLVLPVTERLERLEPISNRDPFDENIFLSERFRANSPVSINEELLELDVLGVRPETEVRLI